MTHREKDALLKRIYALPTGWADGGGSYSEGGPVGSDDAAMLWPEDAIDEINQFAADTNVARKDPITGMRNELQEAVEYLENQLELVRRYAEGYPDKDNYTALADIYTTALDTTLSALRDALQRQPDPITGLVPCGCGGKAKYINSYYDDVWMYENYVGCPGCYASSAHISTSKHGYSKAMEAEIKLKLKDNWNTSHGYTAPPRPGAIGPGTGEMDPNGDEGAEL